MLLVTALFFGPRAGLIAVDNLQHVLVPFDFLVFETACDLQLFLGFFFAIQARICHSEIVVSFAKRGVCGHGLAKQFNRLRIIFLLKLQPPHTCQRTRMIRVSFEHTRKLLFSRRQIAGLQIQAPELIVRLGLCRLQLNGFTEFTSRLFRSLQCLQRHSQGIVARSIGRSKADKALEGSVSIFVVRKAHLCPAQPVERIRVIFS